ncbi:hypothetical protein B0H10DRAFT_1946620 [Mycena sp. CBHHK59/15]|nr:hypothetical protein B0H10DRAFT_1946620 [Mycena sp. CBHHK59/15]
MATLSSALSTFSRHLFFRQFICEEIGRLPSTPDPLLLQVDGQLQATAFAKFDCSSPPFLYGILSINIAYRITTCILSALSTGWWSRLGDMYGRRYALMVSVLGSVLLNLIFALVARSPALENVAQPFIFVGMLLEGLLGGSATFQGAVHAYTSDVSLAGSCVSAVLGLANLAFIIFFLPESLPEEFRINQPLKINLNDFKTSVYSAVTVFMPGLATTGHRGENDIILLSFPCLASSTTHYFFSVMGIDGSIARYLVSGELISQLLILVIPTSRLTIFFLFMTPLTVGIKPTLYALGAVQFHVVGRAQGRGVFFGALSVWYMVGETLSYVMYVSTYNVLWRSFAKAGFMLTAALLTVVAIFLWPGDPDRIRRDDAERLRIVVSDEAVGPEPSVFSPVRSRHGVLRNTAPG